MNTRVLPLSGSLPQALAGTVGVFGLSLGVAGLAHGGSGHPFLGITNEAFLGLTLNHAHNLLHLIVGVAGLAVMRSLRASRAFGYVLFVFFMVEVLVGLVAFLLPQWNPLGVNEVGNLMHWLLAVVGLTIAWGPEHMSVPRRRRR